MKPISSNKGIDYSDPLSTVNRNTKTGIRYGVISQRHVLPEALDDIFTHGIDLDYEDYRLTVKDSIRSALNDFFSHHERSSGNSPLDLAVESAFDAIADSLGDQYESTGDCTRFKFESDGYKLLTDSSGDLWVLDSPFFTYAQFCSPCAPGACYLSTPVEPDPNNKTYCLGPDWFEDSKPPYTVYSVDTGLPV